MQGINRCLGLILATAFVQACATSNQSADATGKKSGYVASSQEFLKSAQNQCVRTTSWTSNTNVVECQSSAPTPAPAPKPEAIGTALVSFKARALFEFDSYELTNEGRQQLDQLTSKLNRQDEITGIDIVGHTDSRGSDSYNLTLSEQRADSVASYLQQSLKSVSVASNGLGESAPIADNTTDEGRRLNRRVDVKVAALRES